MMSEEQPKESDAATGEDKASDSLMDGSNQKKSRIIGLGLIVVIVIIVLLAVLLPTTGKKIEERETPDTFNFQAGVSLITSYHVESEITSRIARTVISVEIANAL